MQVIHENKKYSCTICLFADKDKSTVSLHFKAIHEGRNEYHCKQCVKKFLRKRSFKDHKKRIHNANGYTCKTCKFKTSSKTYLNQHEQRVHKRAKYPCSDCMIICITKADLGRHKESMHEIQYCKECDHLAANNRLLRIHEREFHHNQAN